MDACTVTALDAITAFAVPNPNYSSQSRRFFQVWLSVGSPRRTDHSAYFGLAKFYLSQPFQPSTEATLEICSKIVNALFRCNRPFALRQETETQPIESLLLNEWQIKFSPFFHSYIHRCSKAGATRRSVWRDYVNILTPEHSFKVCDPDAIGPELSYADSIPWGSATMIRAGAALAHSASGSGTSN